jgi:hypothetical protein
MKLLQAAGIGEYRVGRKGVETRFILADGDPTALDAVCTPERITIGQLPTRSVQPPLDAYSAPEVSTQLQTIISEFGAHRSIIEYLPDSGEDFAAM